MTSFCFVSPGAETIKACLHGSWGPQIGEVTCSGHLTYHVNVIKLKWKIIWKKLSLHWIGGLSHQSELPHLPRVPHPYENRPLERSLSSAEVQWGVRAIFVWPWNENARTKQKQKRTETYWFDWLSEGTQHARELSRNQPILCFDVILQCDWPIEQCLLRIRVFFGGKIALVDFRCANSEYQTNFAPAHSRLAPLSLGGGERTKEQQLHKQHLFSLKYHLFLCPTTSYEPFTAP